MATPPPPEPQPPHRATPFSPPGQPQPQPQQQPYLYPYPATSQPWGHAAWRQTYPLPPSSPLNGLAIAALVLGVLCFLPGVGLLLGIVALVQISKRGERGKGMAVAGIALSTIGALLMTLVFTTGGARDVWDGFRDVSSGAGGTFSVDKGECFDSPRGSLEEDVYDVDVVPCAGEHDAEVFAVFSLPEGEYPGDAAVSDAADEQCYVRSETYAMDTWALPPDVDVYWFTPTRQSWRYGDREVICVFGDEEAEGSLTGSLRQDETTLDDDQFAFLEGEAILRDAFDGVPDTEYVEDDLTAHKVWAGQMVRALERQTSALRAHEWGHSAEEAVTAYVEALDRARVEWEGANRASDADDFSDHWDKSYGLTHGPKVVTARKALGLTAESPLYDGEGGGDGAGEGGSDAHV
ncbi:DUF4190 domain-containing protein [Streptomyces sp. NPDC012510]|uniref:DUF4190 domain-containing protein n=1 Tax=Streptomyces sp. NPDC012510 TaxID=3364838 RepID=UPI0036E1093C